MMTDTNVVRAVTVAVTVVGSVAGHETGDYLIQRDCDAQRKQQHDAEGKRALATHAASYTLTHLAAKTAVYRAAGLRIPALANLAGSLTEGIVHAIVDDGRVLRWFADATGKIGFHDLANHGINGRALMDQALHKSVQIPLGAAITAAIACSGKRG